MFSHSVKIAFFCLVAVIVAAAEEDDAGRIVGGQLTTSEQVPYLVQLRESNGRYFCGGTILTWFHVLTAAHCVDKKSLSNINVIGGATTRYEAGELRTVARAIPHPLYDKAFPLDYDVAVLILNNPMSGTIPKPIQLSTQIVSAGTNIQVSGLGYTTESGPGSPQVRTVVMPTISTAECIRQYGSHRISGTMFCASVPGVKDACSGDSGGPAIAGNKVVGIVSWGTGCGHVDHPGVYTDVAVVLPFIDECLDL